MPTETPAFSREELHWLNEVFTDLQWLENDLKRLCEAKDALLRRDQVRSIFTIRTLTQLEKLFGNAQELMCEVRLRLTLLQPGVPPGVSGVAHKTN